MCRTSPYIGNASASWPRKPERERSCNGPIETGLPWSTLSERAGKTRIKPGHRAHQQNRIRAIAQHLGQNTRAYHGPNAYAATRTTACVKAKPACTAASTPSRAPSRRYYTGKALRPLSPAKKPLTLPKYIRPQVVKRLFDHNSNLKQNTLLRLYHGMGLRVNELPGSGNRQR